MGRPGLTYHRKFLRLARAVGGAAVARGSLELVWERAYENGEEFLGDAEDVEAAAHWQGEKGALALALRDAGGPHHAGFIEEGRSKWWRQGRRGTFRVHDLWDHAPRYVNNRAAREAERRQRGQSLAEVRADAGRKGGEAKARTVSAPSKRVATDRPVATSGKQLIATPAPAHSPPSRPCEVPDLRLRARTTWLKGLRKDLWVRWFQPCAWEQHGTTLVLVAPDRHHAAFLKDNYADLLAERAGCNVTVKEAT